MKTIDVVDPIRIRLGIPKNELARRLKMEKANFRRLMAREFKKVSLETIDKLASALRVSRTELTDTRES